MSDELNLQQLSELANAFCEAKKAEATAICNRIQTEERIAALIPTKDVGQKTVTLPDGQKITVKRGLNYKADVQAIENAYCWVSLGYSTPVKTKTTRELDVAGYEWYRNNNSDIFAKLSQYVTVTPKKVAVSLSLGKAE